MCGIFALLNIDSNTVFESKTQIVDDKMEFIKSNFIKGVQRGPECSKLEKYNNSNLVFGFHRLAINGLNNESNQPLSTQKISLICNGEIYNYKNLYESMNIKNTISQSDCEVIIHLYLKYGIEQTLIMLDGVFSFILFDNRDDNNKKLYIARDPYGVRPLYYLFNRNDNYRLFNLYGFASELKCLSSIYNLNTYHYHIKHFEPGTYSSFIFNKGIWQTDIENTRYFIPRFSNSLLLNDDCIYDILNKMYCDITYYFESAVIKRCITTERPVACLLSGGLDSSLVAALVNNFRKKKNINQKLETYSIGLEGSEDLRCARIVANYLETDHHEIIVTEDDMFDAIPEVIEAIESYDTTTVRASIGNYLLGKYIKAHSKAKVIFNGDGSDELFGGYLYMNKCPDDIEFDKETRRLLKDIHLFDVLRSDKCISSHGLEPRTPFLDRTFTNFVLSIPTHYRNHKNGIISFYGAHTNLEKILLRRCFSFGMFYDWQKRQILPDEILWRRKEAFSDGVSSKDRSLFTILQEKIAQKMNEENENGNFIPNIDTEKQFYKQLFDKLYPNCENILPYYWMPKYTDATDPSARTLVDYDKSKA
jgi:asparagine synthase (glutamine-hydrolysing)